MKKLISILLLVAISMSAMMIPALAESANTNWAFGFNAYTDGSTLNHNEDKFHKKVGDDNFIEVRHKVTGDGSTAGHTNYMYAKIYRGNYVGAKWHAPNMIYYQCISNSLTSECLVTPGGRANTKYKEQQGLNRVMLEGQFRTH